MTSLIRHVFWALMAMTAVSCSYARCGGSQPIAVIDGGATIPKAVGSLDKVEGSVSLERESRVRAASPGLVYRLDIIETENDSRAWVRIDEGEFEIGPDSRFIVGEDKGGLLFEVSHGVITSRRSNEPGTETVSLTIKTPFGFTRVLPGSQIVIQIGPDEAKVMVTLGKVQMVARNGETREVAAGEASFNQEGFVENRVTRLQPIRFVVRLNGQAQIKRSGQTRWQKISDDSPAGPGDAIRVSRGTARLALEGTKTDLVLSKATELAVDSSEGNEALEHARIQLRRGQVEVVGLSATQKSIEAEGWTLSNQGIGQYSITRTGKTLEVAALTTDVAIQKGDLSGHLAAGYRMRLSESELTSPTPIAASELRLTSTSGTRVFHSGVSEASIVWNDKAGSEFFIEVGDDAKLSSPLVSGYTHTPFVNVPIPAKGNLYWRVSSKDRSTELAAGSAVFGQEPKRAALGLLTNEVFETGEQTSIHYQDKPPAVTFNFKAAEAATAYRFALYRKEALTEAIIERQVSSTRLPLEAGLITEGDYLWSATPLTPSDEEIAGAKMNKLEVIYDNSNDTLIVREPVNGAVVKGPVRYAGVAPVDSTVRVNDVAVSFDEKRRFEGSLLLPKTSSLMVFRVSRSHRPDVLVVRNLKRGIR